MRAHSVTHCLCHTHTYEYIHIWEHEHIISLCATCALCWCRWHLHYYLMCGDILWAFCCFSQQLRRRAHYRNELLERDGAVVMRGEVYRCMQNASTWKWPGSKAERSCRIQLKITYSWAEHNAQRQSGHVGLHHQVCTVVVFSRNVDFSIQIHSEYLKVFPYSFSAALMLRPVFCAKKKCGCYKAT